LAGFEVTTEVTEQHFVKLRFKGIYCLHHHGGHGIWLEISG
jgi:hypothetical protein